ncbi:hypothetical protein BHE74_00012671 [Ensete ventricosum]|nr:hypothetical protein GW17_00032449 [Ensete ventricosum]RWW79058.1 hypothetical protein BHE74_00012671 [Ensete ventricosum]RZR91813.1 hypothetical protein BHM03_00019998 [Ensete ventricosum]
MDPVKMEKLQAMRSYRRNHFFLVFLQYVLRVVLVGLFLSCPNWLPSICSFVKFFFVVCLPNIGATVSGPKFVFVVSNIIIIFLVGESRLSKSPAQQPGIYEDYVSRRQSQSRSQSLQRMPSVEVKEKEAVMVEPSFEETKEKDEETVEEEEVKGDAGEEELETEREELLEEEYEELPAEELNRRVEDFIAKVNMQRKLEARMLI